MATIDPEVREQQLRDAQDLLHDRYGAGRAWHDPVRAMHAVRAAADGYDQTDGPDQVDVPLEDVLAALTQLDQARADLDVLERDLTRAARSRDGSWQQIATALGLSSRTSAESRAVRLERGAASHGADRYPDQLRAARARDRAGDDWCHANERRLREAVHDLATFNDTWPDLALAAPAGELTNWATHLDGPGLAARLRGLRPVLTFGPPPSAEASHPLTATALRDEVRALLDEMIAARHGLPAADSEQLS